MSNLRKRVAEIIARHMASGAISGAVVALSQNGEELFVDAQGASDIDTAHPLQPDSIFPIFSLTKVVAAACIMLLAAEKKLSVDDPVSRWISSFSAPRMIRDLAPGEESPPFYPGFGPPPVQPEYLLRNAAENIRIHHLLSMTSGLQTMGLYNPDIPVIEPHDSLASWVDKLGGVSLEFEPGSRWHYSNATGFDVLGRIVECATGESFGSFARSRFFEPLGMVDTTFGIGDPAPTRLVPPGPLGHAPVLRPGYHSGSAGLLSTARDYTRFLEMLRIGSVGAGSILTSEAVALMRQNQIGTLGLPGIRAAQYSASRGTPAFGLTYGYGVAIVEKASDEVPLPAGSFGWDGIGTRRAWVIPEFEAVLVMLMPGIGPIADHAHREIEAAVCGSLSK